MNSNPGFATVVVSLICVLVLSVSIVTSEAIYSFSATSPRISGPEQAISKGPKGVVIAGNATLTSLIKKANALYIAGEYKDAISYYDKALVIQPNNASLLVNKGNALSQIGNFTGAIKTYDQALVIRPNSSNNFSIFVNRGNALFQSGKLDEAVKSYDRALAIKPNLKNAITNKANVLFELGNYTGAIIYYDKALSMTSENSMILINSKAHALFELGNYTGAIIYYDKVLSIAPGSASAQEGKYRAVLALNNSTKK